MSTRDRLRLVRGPDLFVFGALELTLADAAPFNVQGTVLEEDTFLVLGASPGVRAPHEHPVRVITSAFTFEPLEPGSVVVRTGPPLELQAVIHDLDQEPSCREEWVARALDGVLRACGHHGIEALATPLLGSVHHVLQVRRAALALVRALRSEEVPGCLRRIWLRAPTEALPVVRGWLRQVLEQEEA
jgi:hypothetical protein